MPERVARSPWAPKAALLVVSVVVALGVAELAARLLLPSDVPPPVEGEANVIEADAELGWRNRPGGHVVRHRTGGRTYPVTVTVGADGARLPGLPRPAAPPSTADVAVIGCSYTFGWGVNDDETYAAILARRFPRYRVVNLASNAYGTYQALLSLERRYRDRPAPKLVIYGFLAHHADRNVVTAQWQRILTVMRRAVAIDVPYVSVTERGKLVRHPPALFGTPWPCAVSVLCRSAYHLGRMWLDPGSAQKEAAMRALFLSLQEWAGARGARLLVALLDRTDTPRYEAFLTARGIPYVKAESDYAMLPYDGLHPGPEFHADVADRLERAMRASGL
jgi:hypothetical protein